MKIIILALSLLFSSLTWSFDLSRKALDNNDLKFISHQGEGRFGSYLTMEVHYPPVEKLRQQLESKVGTLNNRGEAHITVVTPIEYFDVLKEKNVTMDEIDAIAIKHNIQAARYRVVCLARGEAAVEGKKEQTYFVVVASDDLVNIRKSVQDLFVKKGGQAEKFRPEHFFPHITLGFTTRDLHESDGVLKDENLCLPDGQIKIVP